MRVPMGFPIITPMQKKASRKANLDFNEIIKKLKVQKTWPSLYFHLLHQPNSCSPARKGTFIWVGMAFCKCCSDTIEIILGDWRNSVMCNTMVYWIEWKSDNMVSNVLYVLYTQHHYKSNQLSLSSPLERSQPCHQAHLGDIQRAWTQPKRKHPTKILMI